MNNLLSNKFFVILIIPFLLGSITALGFPPYNFVFINFFSFSFLLYLIFVIKKGTYSKYRKKKSKQYFFYLGSSFGVGFFLFGNYWISISLTHDEAFRSLIPFALILIPMFLSIFFGLSIFLVGSYAEKNISFILLFSLVFSIFEFLRGNILTGFPWNLMAYSWSFSLEIIQIISLIGTYSFSLISITFFCIPFLLFQKKYIKKNFIYLLFFILIFIGNYSYGWFKISLKQHIFDKSIFVKIVSPNFTLNDYKTKSEATILKRLIKISKPEKYKKTLFIWPEGIFHETNLHDIKKYEYLFSEKFSENHLIILGTNNFNNSLDQNNYKYFNSLVLLNNKLEVLSAYNKIKLVPFGEFLPLENFLSRFGFKKITSGYNSFSPGISREVINLGKDFNNKSILPLICYEIIYSGQIKKKDQLPDLIINISEDGWFGDSTGPYQHFSKAIYRAIEEGVFVARSANKGISALIDTNGKIIKSLNTGESGNIELYFPKYTKSTLFSELGNKIFYLIILLYMFLILILRKYKI